MDIKLNSKIYPVEAILNASYVFIEKAYVFLDYDKKDKNILVSINGKRKFSSKQSEALRGSFLNELLYSSLRCAVSKRNKKLREYIVGRALYSNVPQQKQASNKQKEMDYRKDPLGIAVPWEKKHKRKKCRK